jgi:hypothetical protein
MDMNITERRYSDDNLQIAEPHFEEEATLLSAQPVVPLDEIRDDKPEAGSKKHWAFGLSIVASLIIGAVGATMVFRQRGQRSASEIVETAIAGSEATAKGSSASAVSTGEVSEADRDLSGGTVPEANSAEAQAVAPLEQQTARQIARQNPPLSRKTPTEVLRRNDDSQVQIESEEVIYPEDERELRRAERIEARRQRRRMAAREEWDRNGRRRRRSGDLLRIREIFEGSRRP